MRRTKSQSCCSFVVSSASTGSGRKIIGFDWIAPCSTLINLICFAAGERKVKTSLLRKLRSLARDDVTGSVIAGRGRTPNYVNFRDDFYFLFSSPLINCFAFKLAQKSCERSNLDTRQQQQQPNVQLMGLAPPFRFLFRSFWKTFPLGGKFQSGCERRRNAG